MTLLEAITQIQYDGGWGIWADAPFTPHSDARYGQCQFENGGLLDGKEFFADGEECGDYLASWLDGIDDPEPWMSDEGATEMIRETEEERRAEADAGK